MEASNTGKTADPQVLRTLVPLESLSAGNFERVAEEISVRRVEAGTLLFRRGKQSNYSLYLLKGCVELSTPHDWERVEAGSERARHPLVGAKPRQFTGTALTDCVVAVVDSALLEKYMTWDQMAHRPVPGYEVQEFEGTADVEWMLQMLQTKVFTRLPTGNIQSLFSRFEELPVNEGQIILSQGETGDYYYIIKQGRCRVTRQTEPGATDMELAQLGPRDAFGEESLLSDQPRNATVTMITEGTLMRLAKKDFRTLMTEPLVKQVDADKMTSMMRLGAVALDVRLESEYQHGSLKGAVNVPLYLIRLKAASLDPAERYIVVCDTGARSAAAAFLLGERGLDVRVLTGGLASLARSQQPDRESAAETPGLTI